MEWAKLTNTVVHRSSRVTKDPVRALGRGAARNVYDSLPIIYLQAEDPCCASYASREANGDSAECITLMTWKPHINCNFAIS